MTEVDALHEVHRILADTYTFDGRQIWVRSRNRNLDMQRPEDLIKSGRYALVLAEAHRVAGDGKRNVMTDLPKLSPHEMLEVMNVLNKINEDTKPRKRSHKAKTRPWCGCDCDGCNDPDSNSKHCLDAELGCTRKHNRRSKAEIEVAGRYPSGRIRNKGVSKPLRRSPRSPDEIERYPGGWPIPIGVTTSRQVKTHPETQPKTHPENQWFVHASRGETNICLPVFNEESANHVAENLVTHGWEVRIIEGVE